MLQSLTHINTTIYMNKRTLFLAAIVFTACVALYFIYNSNDHIECEIKTEVTYGSKGEKIITDTHICKEKFNL